MFWIWSLRTLASLSLWALLGSQPLQAQNVLQFRDVEAYVAGTFVNQGQHHQSTYRLGRTGERVTATFSAQRSFIPSATSQAEVLFTVPEGFRPATVVTRSGEGIPVQADGTPHPIHKDPQQFWLRVEPNGAVRYAEVGAIEGEAYLAYTVSVAWATTLITGDRMALEALIVGGSEVADHWEFDSRWEGVITNAAGRVTHVNRGANCCVVKVLPAELGDLTALEMLDLNSTGIHGPIPPVLGQLSALRVLDLRRNLLDGPIPLELTHLKSLEVLDLGQNQLTGTIPPELALMPALQVLHLGRNQLTGEIPWELGQMQALQGLYLMENQLSGLISPELGQMQALQELLLGQNQLTGEIPAELGQLQALQLLDLGQNQLNGIIPPELGQMQALQELYLYDNQLNGIIPPELGQLQSLQELYLHDNQLSGPIPPELGQMQALQKLHMGDNQFSGSIPPELGQLKELNTLILSHNGLDGIIPPELGQIYDLKQLNLIGNSLKGPIPLELGRFTFLYETVDQQVSGCRPWETNCLADTQSVAGDRAALMALYAATQGDAWLRKDHWGHLDVPLAQWYGVTTDAQGRVTHLELPTNQLQGEFPLDLWANLGSLLVLDLSDNQLHGPVPWTFRWLSKLQRLSLARNQLSGNIPPAFMNYTVALEILDLGSNQLSGSIPKSWGLSLKVLVLRDNQLNGSIPNVGGVHRNLEVLDLGENQLSGTIPVDSDWLKPTGLYPYESVRPGHRATSGLDIIETLVVLDLSNNQLSGILPPTLGRLDSLQRLELRNNQLEGPIPSEWGLFPALRELDLRDNVLTGPIPPELGRLDFSPDFPLLSGNQFSGCVPWSGDSYTGRQLPSCYSAAYSVEEDRAALMAIYEATNGDDWLRNDNWGRADLPLEDWFGVSTDAEGRVTRLELVSLGLRGVLPQELWGPLSALRVLELDHNELSGPIPWSLSRIPNLQWLSLAGNQLNGTIPPVLGRLEVLEVLDLGHNDLSGIIPPALGQLQALKVLDLGFNHLRAIASQTGVEMFFAPMPWAVPKELGQLQRLQALDLANNNLYGNIPPELGELGMLQWVDLWGNEWISCLPPSWSPVHRKVEESNFPICESTNTAELGRG